MNRYAYDNCPVCGLIFKDSDDIVVCPTCGTPHHRECYINSGSCANDSKHDDGFIFVSTAPAASEEPQKSSQYSAEEPVYESSGDNSSDNANPFESDTFNSPYGHVITDNERIDDIPVGDLKKFIGPAWIYYVPLFYAKVKGLRIFRINFSAFIGSYAWLFARKFYLLGLISALLSIGSYLFMDFFEAYLVSAGFDLTVSNILSSNDPMILLGYYAYMFMSNIPFILSILTGIFANKLYMKRCIKKIKKINHSSSSAEQFNSRLAKRGGLNMPMLFLSGALYICYFILAQRGVIAELMTKLIEYLF